MAIVIKSGSRELIPAGLHLAICTDMVEMGTSEDTFGDDTKPRTKIWLAFEACNEKRKDADGNEFCLSIGSTYTASLGKEAKLRKALESWRSKAFTAEELKGFDLTKVLGKPCMITVVHKSKSDGSQKAEITAISSIEKGREIPSQVNPTRLLELDNFDQATFDALPEFLQKEIRRSDEFQAMNQPKFQGKTDGQLVEELFDPESEETPF